MHASVRHLEATERHLGGWTQLRDALEASWSHLGGIWGHLVATEKHLEATERHLGDWRQLRGTLEASWRHFHELPVDEICFSCFSTVSGATEHPA